jgi:Ca2+-binding EF-hand superfamily protein
MFRSILCAGALSLAGAVSAQAMSDLASLGQRADTNHDGVVSREEFLAARAAQFDRFDRNHDGYLDTADADVLPEPTGRMFQWMERLADADGDGRISRDEFNGMPVRGFERMDANQDGLLEPDEMQRVMHNAQQRLGRVSH